MKKSLAVKYGKISYLFGKLRAYLFVGLLVLLYSFIIIRFISLNAIMPTTKQINAASNITSPHIDQTTVNKIQQLQDNSVSVKALFNQARQNPFQE